MRSDTPLEHPQVSLASELNVIGACVNTAAATSANMRRGISDPAHEGWEADRIGLPPTLRLGHPSIEDLPILPREVRDDHSAMEYLCPPPNTVFAPITWLARDPMANRPNPSKTGAMRGA